MKNSILFLIAILSATLTLAQQNGTISAKKLSPKAGVENTYEYLPPKGLQIPQKAFASILYFNKGYFKKSIALTKAGDKYDFAFTAPDSADVLVIAVLDGVNNVIDNNKEAGYISYLYDSKGNPFTTAKVTQAMLLAGYAAYFHKTMVPSVKLIKLYEEGFAINPGLKKSNFYINYLSLLYKEKKDAAIPQLLDYANQMLATNGNEGNWLYAYQIYSLLKMEDNQEKTSDKILAAYPMGELAKQNFWNDFRKLNEPTEITLLAAMNDYQQRFKDSSGKYLENIYLSLIFVLAKNKDLDGILKYAAHVENKLTLASIYNNIAWGLSGEGLEGQGRDLDFAKAISKLSVDYVEEKMKQPVESEIYDELVGAYIGYSDTYALILYKLNDFDSAFYYQHAILQRGPMGVEGMERYAAYAEKSKGAEFAKDFIEPQLLGGVNSPVMQKQLQSLYRQLNLSETAFSETKEKFTTSARQKSAEKIIARFGTQKGAELNLKDLQGRLVLLSSLKGKVVVLDFWATWCGPCRASFPHMQELVDKYKMDQEVVFLFIDTWEQRNPKIMHENAVKFIKDNNYSFQVLLDEKDKVAGDYKVEGIPAKFVIDKNGNIVFMGEAGNDLGLIIESAKSY